MSEDLTGDTGGGGSGDGGGGWGGGRRREKGVRGETDGGADRKLISSSSRTARHGTALCCVMSV